MLKQEKRFDLALLIVVLAIVAVGLVFVYSASSYTAQKHYDNEYHLFLSK